MEGRASVYWSIWAEATHRARLRDLYLTEHRQTVCLCVRAYVYTGVCVEGLWTVWWLGFWHTQNHRLHEGASWGLEVDRHTQRWHHSRRGSSTSTNTYTTVVELTNYIYSSTVDVFLKCILECKLFYAFFGEMTGNNGDATKFPHKIKTSDILTSLCCIVLFPLYRKNTVLLPSPHFYIYLLSG